MITHSDHPCTKKGEPTVQHYGHRPEVIDARLTALARQTRLETDENFAGRAAALDVIQQVYQLLQLYQRDTRWGRYRRPLKQQAEALERRLRAVDEHFFQRLRHRIRSSADSTAQLREFFNHYTPYRPGQLGHIHRGYDALDALVQGLMRTDQAPRLHQPHDIEMVHYEPTPARAVLDLVDRVRLTAEDIFYDLGAGLGLVVMLVHLLTGAISRGVEIESAYVVHARQCAEELGVSGVEFLNLDARHADYTDGTVFFMYTPFTGALMDAVLARLEAEAHRRPITICTYGACTAEVAEQSWLRLSDAASMQAYALAIFRSG